MKNVPIVKIAIFLLIMMGFTAIGIHDYSKGKDKRIVQSHRGEHHPVINALFAQKIRLNQKLENLIASWPPSRYSKHDDFTTLYYIKNKETEGPCCGGYSTYIHIVAMDDKLVKALAVEGVLSEIEYVFFNKLDRVTEDIYWTSRLKSVAVTR